MKYVDMTPAQLQEEYNQVSKTFSELKQKGLKLDMSRGKPGKEQLDAVSDILTVLSDPKDCILDGLDVRNYGGLTGLACVKNYFAEILGCKPEECFIGGNASLTMMYDTIAKAYTHGLLHSEKPWCKLETVKFLCPSPGYDRHFNVTKSFGMELIPIPMTENGPDMDAVEQAVKDPAVKGIWCVPKYSNPEGIIYSPETISRIAHLKPAAPDFVVMWDNAYCVHDLTDEPAELLNIYDECVKEGTEDQVIIFASTSKISFPGAGVAALASSAKTIASLKSRTTIQTIGSDKLNQLRHVLFLHDADGVRSLMKGHRQILAPKFRIVLDALERELGGLGIARWSEPKGGYFVCLDVLDGCAKRVVGLCKEAGVTLTDAGATYPYGNDPHDSNIRIAPSFPPQEELRDAMELLCVAIKLAAAEKLLEER